MIDPKQPTVDELLDIIRDFVADTCTDRTVIGGLDSCAVSHRADAMRLLAGMGEIKITSEWGRRVIGHWAKRTEARP